MPVPIAGCILAGGRARRFGHRAPDGKAAVRLAGRPLISHVHARFAPQVGALAISGDPDNALLRSLHVPILADCISGFAGPLAGIVTALAWARALKPPAPWLVTVPVDAPFLPIDLVNRLVNAATHDDESVAVASGASGMQPIFTLWPTRLSSALEARLLQHADRSLRGVLQGYARIDVRFPTPPGAPDPFFNINRPSDLAYAEAAIKHIGG